AYGVNAVASGFAGLPFMDIVAKTIPIERRGSYFGGRLFAGGVLGLAASVIVGVVLSAQNPQPFPINVGTLFVLSWVAAVLGLTVFALIKEPPSDVRDDGATFTAHMQRAARLPRQNQNLRYLLIARVVILLSYVAAPFYSIYSINVLGAPASIIGVYMGVRTVMALLTNPIWSRLSDRRGNKIVMQLATAVGVVMLAWVVFLPAAGHGLTVPASIMPYALVPVYALMGVYETGVGIGAINLTLEVAPPHDRAIYIGLTNTTLGVAYLSTAVSGIIVDLVGYEGVFILGLILLLVASWALWRLRDPRELMLERKTNAG
ncbi:MAG TPA: MFS transporter, partial [Anaerolineae bacterium]|nr:MFS transporter [Anaerolineae bacterium]